MKSIRAKSAFQKTSAMTLTEVLVAASIGVVVLGASTWFLFEGTRISYQAMSEVDNGIQQWGLSTKLQIDGKIANGVTIFDSLDILSPDYLKVVPVDDGDKNNGLERGNALVLTKTQLNQGQDTGVIAELIVYLYTPGSAPNYGTLKRFPAVAPNTFAIAAPLDASGKPKTVATLVDDNIATILSGMGKVQDHVISVAANKGPFASFGTGKHVSIAVVREASAAGGAVRSNLTEVSFNLR